MYTVHLSLKISTLISENYLIRVILDTQQLKSVKRYYQFYKISLQKLMTINVSNGLQPLTDVTINVNNGLQPNEYVYIIV